MPTRNKEIDRLRGIGAVRSQDGQKLAQVSYSLVVRQREEDVAVMGGE